MAWIPFAAASIPSLINMFQGQPSMPGPSGVGNIKLPDRSAYTNKLLQLGFDPQSSLYDIARSRTMANINSDLARKGLGFSTSGNQSMNSAMAELANQFLQSQLQREATAYGAVTGYDTNAASIQAGLANQTQQDAWNRYNAQMGNSRNTLGTISNLATLGAGAYGAVSNANTAATMQATNQANMDRYFGILENNQQALPSGGYYSGVPGGGGFGQSGPYSTMGVGGQPNWSAPPIGTFQNASGGWGR